MAKQVRQFRYYAPNSPKNYPSGMKYQSSVSGSVFSETLPVFQLGIQALPGTQFYLNDSVHPVIIGSTGIYELDLEGKGTISAISFDNKSIDMISENDNAYLIVDVIYDDGQGEE